MLRRIIPAAVAVAVLISLVLPVRSMAAAPMGAISDGGYFEHLYVGPGKPWVDTIQFLWIPEGRPDATFYTLSGFCTHIDLERDEFAGKFKAIFKQVTLSGLDTDLAVSCPTIRAKVRGGLVSKYATCDLGSLGKELATNDSAVLVTGRVKIKGTVKLGGFLQCYLGVNEYDEEIFSAGALLLPSQLKGHTKNSSKAVQTTSK